MYKTFLKTRSRGLRDSSETVRLDARRGEHESKSELAYTRIMNDLRELTSIAREIDPEQKRFESRIDD